MQGLCPQNIERDMQRRLQKHLRIPLSCHPVEVARMNKRTGTVGVSTSYILPPHRIWGELYKTPAIFHTLFGDRNDWEQFWQAHMEERWVQEHSQFALIRDRPHSCCPFIIFGDDAQTSKRVGRTAHMLLWFSPMAKVRGTEGHMPIFICDNDDPCIDVLMNQLQHAAVWSFRHASINFNPYCTLESKPLNADMRSIAGTPIIPGTEPLFLVALVEGGLACRACIVRIHAFNAERIIIMLGDYRFCQMRRSCRAPHHDLRWSHRRLEMETRGFWLGATLRRTVVVRRMLGISCR